MTHPNTDQGVTAEDREAAATVYDLLGFGPCQHIIDGMEDDIGVVPIVQRHRLSSTAALEAEIASLKQRLESAGGHLRRARRIIADIDDYMARPGRGDWGEECACCMGELLDDDRPTLIVIDTFLQEQEKQNG